MKITVKAERFPIKGKFTISRGSKKHIEVLTCQIEHNGFCGTSEAVPYTHYEETMESVTKQIKAFFQKLTTDSIDEAFNQSEQKLSAGSARNAIDCALWDLRAKITQQSVSKTLHYDHHEKCNTALTLSLDTPEIMAKKAKEAKNFPLLKIKLGGKEDEKAMRAIRHAAPDKTLIIDANEGWHQNNFEKLINYAKTHNIALIEQPLPSKLDYLLEDYNSPVCLCADESFHTLNDFEKISQRYQAINIKLDKTGGLTHALKCVDQAQKLKLKIMIGCMLGTSLAMAPAFYLTKDAHFIDLDGPLLLKEDRTNPISYHKATMHLPPKDLWG